jgi:hypothetical protein
MDAERVFTVSGTVPAVALSTAGVSPDGMSGGPMSTTISVLAEPSRQAAKVESLGTQNIGGVQADGKRVTETIPAGAIGNEREINVVNETWYSPELQTVVMSKYSDPRTGDVVYTLTNINRSEPDPALFQVPADYKMKEEPGHFNIQDDHKMLTRQP